MPVRGCCQDNGITSRLDWRNPLYYVGITDELLRRLQSVQNAAARLITDT